MPTDPSCTNSTGRPNPLTPPQPSTFHPAAMIRIPNPHIASRDTTVDDSLYHLALSRHQHDLPAMFGDVKFICMGGTASRMLQFITYITDVLGLDPPPGGVFKDYSKSAGRYSLYKNGPVIAVSHGMGFASTSILMNELIKLMHYACATDVRIFRIGTSGGIGIPPGSVVVTNRCLDGLYRSIYEMPVLGKLVSRESKVDEEMAERLVQCSRPDDNFDVHSGATMSAGDFYEGQGRLDGAFCDFTEADKLTYLQGLHDRGVVNVEMEALLLGSMCHYAGIKLGIVCVTLLDRLHNDQVAIHKETEKVDYAQRPQTIVGRYIKQCYEGTLS